MSRESDEPVVVKRIVVYIDVCSSTAIFEELLKFEQQTRWRNLLIQLKNFLRKKRQEFGFEIYKFIGDGWILLFEVDFQKRDLFSFLSEVCRTYDTLFKTRIAPVLSVEMDAVGVSFGIDMGTLMSVVMNSQTEYIGRPLNVAARLQSAAKDGGNRPQSKVLLTKSTYEHLKSGLEGRFRANEVERTLRNVSGQNLKVMKVSLDLKPKQIV